MRVELKAGNIELTEAIASYVQKKMDMLERFMNIPGAPENPMAFVELEKVSGEHHQKGDVFRCEVQFDLGQELLRVEKTTVDLYKAIDKVKDELERQLVRRKNKRLDDARRV